QLREHLLRYLRERAQWRLSGMRRRARSPAAARTEVRVTDGGRRALTPAGARRWPSRAPSILQTGVDMHTDPVVIVGAARTPLGGLQGDFATLAASELGAVAIKAALDRAGVQPVAVDKVIMGCVLPAGQGQAPARQASLKAGLPLAAGCTTVNKMC